MNQPSPIVALDPVIDRPHEIAVDPTKLKVVLDGIVSCGMRGAESAALMVAEAACIHIGGWAHRDCPTPPKGHKATPSNTWTQSVAHNVRDSDATLVFTFSPLNGPPRIAVTRAKARRKPAMHVSLRPRGEVSDSTIEHLRAWIDKHKIRVLHVTGSRQETDGGIEQAVVDVLTRIFEGPP